MQLPENVQTLIEDFEFLTDWEDRYMHVIDMGKQMEPLPDAFKVDANKVKGCVSQVWLQTHYDPNCDILTFKGDSDAHIVKGLVAIVFEIYSGRSPQTIVDMDAAPVLKQLGLSEHLSPQRSNGLKAMISRIKAEALSRV
ncbi:MAG: SufE family protein [Hellea sp.]|nr:SufE family protein [Hellea sp.]